MEKEGHNKEHVINIEIYTDGSLKKVGQKLTFGGWAFLVVKDNKCINGATGTEENTTNQRMELTAIKEALKYIAPLRCANERITIYSDSAYIINCYLQDWYIKWQNNGWKSSGGNDVANQDLWKDIVPYFDHFWYSFKKVEAHNGVYWNERCDEYAQAAADKIKKSWRGIKND